MNVNILKLLAPLALLAGCAKTTAPEYSWATDPNAVIVKASVGTLTRSNPLGSEDEQKKFKKRPKVVPAYSSVPSARV